ncbi:MAG: transposase [Gammaproteobacteria bacterium]|nr:transposase [Gammaproteobacteria bacterium]
MRCGVRISPISICQEDYFKFYNDQRPHQALNNRTPTEVYANRSTRSP